MNPYDSSPASSVARIPSCRPIRHAAYLSILGGTAALLAIMVMAIGLYAVESPLLLVATVAPVGLFWTIIAYRRMADYWRLASIVIGAPATLWLILGVVAGLLGTGPVYRAFENVGIDITLVISGPQVLG